MGPKKKNLENYKSGQDEEPPEMELEEEEAEEGLDTQDPQFRIAQLEQELTEQQEKALRLRADFDNYRKRAYKELANARISGQLETLTPLLNVFDQLDMAVAASDQADNMDAIRQGLKMIMGELLKSLDELHIERIDAVGEEFDPNLHEAVANEPSEQFEEGTVCKQWRCGYKMGDRILRPANVVVSSGALENVEQE